MILFIHTFISYLFIEVLQFANMLCLISFTLSVLSSRLMIRDVRLEVGIGMGIWNVIWASREPIKLMKVT